MQEKIGSWLDRVARKDLKTRQRLAMIILALTTVAEALLLGTIYTFSSIYSPVGVRLVGLMAICMVVIISLRNFYRIAKPLRRRLGLKEMPDTLAYSNLYMTLPAIMVSNVLSAVYKSIELGGGIAVPAYIGIAMMVVITVITKAAAASLD